MGFKNWIANKIMKWLADNANDDEDVMIDMKGQCMSIKDLKEIEKEWIDAGIIR